MRQFGIEQIKKRFDYDRWCNHTNLEQELFIWNYFFSGNELPGMERKHEQKIIIPGWPQSYQTVWCSEYYKEDALLRFDVYECSSRSSAHEFIVYLLKEFQLPLIGRESSGEIGDICFHGQKDEVLLFGRANLVFMVSGIGKVSLPISELMHRYDNDLRSQPDTNESHFAKFNIRNLKFVFPSDDYKGQVPLEFEIYDINNEKLTQRIQPNERQNVELYVKFFSSNGQVAVVEDRFVCKPKSRGKNDLVIYAVDEHQRAVVSRYEINSV
jgi:hypothetical protein